MVTLSQIAQQERKNPEAVSSDIISRWSPRSMSGRVLPDETLTPLFSAAHFAPSAFNNQPWKFYYASRESKRFTDLFQLLVEPNQAWCKNASFLIVLVSKKTFENNGKKNRTNAFDTGAAWEAFAIEGVRRNLVVHAMSGFDYDKAHANLTLSDDFSVECMIAVGEPTEEVAKETVSVRKELKDIVVALK